MAIISILRLTATSTINLGCLGTGNTAKLVAGSVTGRALEAAAATAILLVAEEDLAGHSRAGKEKTKGEELHVDFGGVVSFKFECGN